MSTSLVVFWDKAVDEEKMLSFVGRMNAMSGDAVLKYPGQTTTMSVELQATRMTCHVEWAAGRKVTLQTELDLAPQAKRINGKLTTPFAGYQLVAFDAWHKTLGGARAGDTTDSRLEAQWAGKQAALALKTTRTPADAATKAALVFTSNLNQVGDFSVDFESLVTAAARKHALKVHSAGRSGPASVSVSAALADGRLSRAVAELTTWISGYESLKASVSHDQQAGRVDTGVQLQGPFGYEAAGQLSAKHTPKETAATVAVSSSSSSSSGSASKQTTAASISMNAIHDGQTRKLLVVGQVDGRRSSVDASLTRHADHVQADVVLDNVLTANQVTASLQHAYGSRVHTGGQVSWAADKQLAASVQGEVRGADSIALDGRLTTPAFQTAARLHHQIIAGKLATEFETSVNGDKAATFSADAEWSRTADRKGLLLRVDCRLSAAALASQLDDVQLVVDHARHNASSVSTSVQLFSQTRELVTVRHSLQHQDATNWNNVLSVRAPAATSSLGDARIASKLSWSPARSLHHETDARINGQHVTMKLNAERRGTLSSANGSLATSWTRDLSFQLDNEADQHQVHPVLVIRNGADKPTVRLEAAYNRAPHNPSLMVEITSPLAQPIKMILAFNNNSSSSNQTVSAGLLWNGNQTADVKIEWRNAADTKWGKLLLTTAWPAYASVSAEAGYDANDQKTSVWALAAVNQVEARLEGFAVTRGPEYQAQIAVATPLASYASLKAWAVVDVVNMRAAAKWQPSADADADVYGLDASVTKSGGGQTLAAVFALTSPSADWRNVKVEASLEAAGKSQILVTVNDRQMAALRAAYVSSAAGQGSVSAALTTAFDAAATAAVDVAFDFSPSAASAASKSLTVRLDWNGQTARGGFESRLLSPASRTLTASLAVPCCGIDNLNVSASLVSSPSRQSHAAKLQLHWNDSVRLEMEANASGRSSSSSKGDFSLRATTRLAGYETVTLDGKYDATGQTETLSSITVTRNSKTVAQVAGRVNCRSVQRVQASLDVTTPFDQWKTIRLDAKYDVLSADKTAQATLVRDGRMVRLTATGAMAGLQGRLETRLETPLAGYENLAGELLFNFEQHKKVASFIYDRNEQRNMISAEVERKSDRVSVRATTPFAGYELLSAAAEYALDSKHVRLALTLEKTGKRTELRLNGAVDLAARQASLQARTPFAAYRTVSALVQWSARLNDTDLSLRLTADEANVLEARFTAKLSARSSQLMLKGRGSLLAKSLALSAAYDLRADQVSANLNLERGGGEQTLVNLSGLAFVRDDSLRVEISTPFEAIGTMAVTGKMMRTDAGAPSAATLTVEKEGQWHRDVSVSFNFERNSAIVSIETPFHGKYTYYIHYQ